VRLIVKYGDTGKCFVVKEWDRKLSTTAIVDHNQNGIPLTYDFYGDILGEALDNDTAVKPFDSVPLLSGAFSLAHNRVFLADNTEGYERPSTTSLAFTTSTDCRWPDRTIKESYWCNLQPTAWHIFTMVLLRWLVCVSHRN
jgi:hypothetical protein